jgi:tRNA pseudouridine13 synthase
LKLKRLPEDFQVEELTPFGTAGGPFAYYRLTKRSQGTPEVIEAILRRWNMARAQIGYGGLKDRHAVTVQYVTIKNGPRRELHEKSFDLVYLGQAQRAFGPQDISGNRFRITLRDLTSEAEQQARSALERAAIDGVPNYFDDQRFGSVGQSGEFVAQPWCLGNYERAIWLALADPNSHDRPDEREQKQILRDHWGDWKTCKATLSRSHRRSIVTFLDDRPGDFRGAIARVRVDLRGLYLSAFQSALWNRILAAWLKRVCAPEQLIGVGLQLGSVPFFRHLQPDQIRDLQSTELPLPSARTKLEPGPIEDVVTEVLREAGLELRQVRVKYPRDSFFSKGNRAAAISLGEVTQLAETDDLYPGKRKLTLSFDLPRGSYATIVVKRLTECG